MNLSVELVTVIQRILRGHLRGIHCYNDVMGTELDILGSEEEFLKFVGFVEADAAEISRAGLLRAVEVARGCQDYGGGYNSAAEYEAFQNGIGAVQRVLERIAAGDEDAQTRTVRSRRSKGPSRRSKGPERLGATKD
jgi:hypothetical protein